MRIPITRHSPIRLSATLRVHLPRFSRFPSADHRLQLHRLPPTMSAASGERRATYDFHKIPLSLIISNRRSPLVSYLAFSGTVDKKREKGNVLGRFTSSIFLLKADCKRVSLTHEKNWRLNATRLWFTITSFSSPFADRFPCISSFSFLPLSTIEPRPSSRRRDSFAEENARFCFDYLMYSSGRKIRSEM